MRNYNGRLTAILGAVIIHLAAGVVFFAVKIGSLDIKEISREYEIALEQPAVESTDNLPADRRSYSVEQVLSGDNEMLNIARNLARQPDPEVSREDYIDKVKEEMIREGKLGKENYIDEWKNRDPGEEGLELQNRLQENDKEKKAEDSQDLASRYSGPTRIYYSLEGRTHVWLPLPIYKCEGAGKIVLSIVVTPKGAVTSAEVIEKDSSTEDPCLVETAVRTALLSRFNADIKSQKNQTGTLTYLFVAQ